ncbi:hypothetical protein IJT17_07860, partial [bacterium]|nr:hypothetical protein [bacterium]
MSGFLTLFTASPGWRRGFRRSGRAFTLMEMMLALGLAVLTISMLSYTTMRISATVRMSESRLARKSKLIATAEQIRWQLRCLYTVNYTD